jgi:hypothetical protein
MLSVMGVVETELACLEWTDNAATHEDKTRLADRVVRSLDEYLAIRAAKIESSAAAPAARWCSVFVDQA